MIARVLKVALGLAAAVLSVSGAQAADPYPTRPVRVVVGFAAGGPTDVLARVVAQWLSERLGQQFVVENRVGAGGNVATETVVNARPDGYTILAVVTGNAINTTLYPSLPFDFFRDLQPVAGLGRIPYVVAVHPSVPATTIAELVAHAKANPGKLNFASAGTGGSNHLSTEIFKGMTGTDIVHIVYRGNAAAYTDLIAGRVQLVFADRQSAMPHINSGALRALAVTSTQRLPDVPNLPTVAETVPGYEAGAWYGFAVPRNTPAEIVTALNQAINAGLTDPKVKGRLAELDATPIVMSPAEFTTFMKAEAERWGKAVRDSGAKPD